MDKQEIQDITTTLCGVLSELGFEYHFEADNRSNRKSHYIFVRRPRYMEIRVSDHPRGKIKRRMTLDVGPHGISLDEAIVDIRKWHASHGR